MDSSLYSDKKIWISNQTQVEGIRTIKLQLRSHAKQPQNNEILSMKELLTLTTIKSEDVYFFSEINPLQTSLVRRHEVLRVFWRVFNEQQIARLWLVKPILNLAVQFA